MNVRFGHSADGVLLQDGKQGGDPFRWNQKYGALGASRLRQLRHLAKENLKLKHLLADLSLEMSVLQDVLAKRA